MNIKDLDRFKKYIKEYQYNAAHMCLEYLSSKSSQNALVHLPTGTGKTGVMATLCALIDGNILIVVPNATLPIQVRNEIETNFWKSIGLNDFPDMKINILNSQSQIDSLSSAVKTVFIATIQFIQENAYKNNILNTQFISNINKTINYVFFDEGHREPAKKWSQIIRSLKSKIILFTATPYRNDDSVFKVDKKYIYSEKMKKFIDNGDISNLDFLQLKSLTNITSTLSSSANVTNEELLEIVSSNLCNGKIIIRCKKVNAIENITEYLNSHNIKALGIHSRIKQGVNYLSCGKNIEEKSLEYDVFIHSEILIEGVNVPAIKTLIFLDTFSNFRSTVQQIGRILRCIKSNNVARVYMPDVVIEEHKEQWNYLLDYTESQKEERKYIYSSGIIKKLYVESTSRQVFEHNILIPKRATIYFSEDKTLWDEITKQIISWFEYDNRCNVIYKNSFDNNAFVIYFEEVRHSNFLKSLAYENRNLHICVLIEVPSNQDDGVYYFYFNSNNTKTFDSESLSCSNAGLKNFKSILDTSLEITRARYEKTIPIISSGIRGREIVGREIENTRPSLEQKLSFCSNMTGKNKDTKQIRYINTITSRVSDSDNGSLKEYIDWCSKIVESLEIKNNVHSIFERFSTISMDHPLHGPTYIYAEFDKELREPVTDNLIKEISAKINQNEFEIFIDDATFQYVISQNNNVFDFIAKNNKDNIQLECSEGTMSIVDALKESNFRVYFLKDQLIYIKGRYYKPNVMTKFNKPEDWSMWSDIEPIDDLDPKLCYDEKYGKNKSCLISTWPDDSVFGVLLKYINDKMGTIDYLVCDDMGTEIADFIALDTKNNKIIYIHCKYDEKQLSASTFQEVCGQAMKNIRYIINTSQDNNIYLENRKTKWAIKWPLYGSNATGGNISRCIKGGTAEEIFNQYINMISLQPQTEYEVWLVHSGLSYEALKKDLCCNQQSEETPQLIWLLQSTQDYISDAGAKLKILCAP